MAVKEKRGWVWTAKEKAWIKSQKRKLKKWHDHISEQVKRFEKAVPTLVPEASQVAQPFLATASALVSLAESAERNKYQAMSAEQARLRLRDVEGSLSDWKKFTERPDVHASVTDFNKFQRSKKREHQEHVRKLQGRITEIFGTEEVSVALDAKVANLLQSVSALISTAQGLVKYGSATDGKILQRLLLVHFVRNAYSPRPKIADALADFIHARPRTMRDILKQMFWLMLKGEALFALKKPDVHRSIVATRGQDPMAIPLSMAYGGVMKSMGHWKKQRVRPQSIEKGYFEILGSDFSLEAKPE